MFAKTLRRSLLALGLLTLLPTAPALGANASVTVADKAFAPADVAIAPGESVTWSWSEGGHNVRITEGPVKFDSGFKEAGGTFTRTFPGVGVHRYICDAHPSMRGSVTVGTPPTAPVAPPVAPATASGPLSGAPRLSGVSVSRLAVVTLRASAPGRVRARLRRGSRIVRRWTFAVAAGRNRVPLAVRGVRLGRYRVELHALDASGRVARRLSRPLVVTRAARARPGRPRLVAAPAPAPTPATAPAPAPAPASGAPATVPDDSDDSENSGGRGSSGSSGRAAVTEDR